MARDKWDLPRSSWNDLRCPPSASGPMHHWGGLDFLKAHEFNDGPCVLLVDPLVQVDQISSAHPVIHSVCRMSAAIGVVFNGARCWIRHIYGGLVNLSQVLPADIGAAAACEAYRIFNYRCYMVFEPLGQDVHAR
ncbi:uncharacterized protein LAESUDRAFT_755164 [Laetiporus sulphureus 93-53]|uniref:Uncharacterized protein n=1 Tax=Laetiporus sulphureus 93-53 TaxID=1314785 RepID=A0A165HBW9_9APHY|nr:uncharacterized protein LAESUDRAFT_755164 [Laetiporus sulphureus 93-53]KZT11525.1 hypothetical protein LAESUDRAFT_755164 [Laetiporus sulphureus 93-53]